MYTVPVILLSTGVVLLLLVAAQVVQFQRIRRRMALGSRSKLVEMLGQNYKHKVIHSNLSRYKWRKGVFIVRADFDAEGKLVGSSKVSLRLFKRRQESFFV